MAHFRNGMVRRVLPRQCWQGAPKTKEAAHRGARFRLEIARRALKAYLARSKSSPARTLLPGGWRCSPGYTLFRSSIALTEFLNAFSKIPLPMVPTTKPSSRPEVLPSRTTTTSMSGVPVGVTREVVGVADAPPHRLELVVVRTTRLGSGRSHSAAFPMPPEPSVTSASVGPL